MKVLRKQTKSVLALMASVLTVIFAMLLFSSQSVKAATVDVNGLTAADAKIYDLSGNDVTSNTQLDKYTGYKVNYNWTINDGVVVNNGDTATFTIPSNISIITDATFPINDEYGNVIGEATVTAGSHTGSIVFNSYLSTTTLGRHGTLYFYGNGTYDSTTGNENWVINKVGSVLTRDTNNSPKVLRWNIALNVAGKNLSNVVLTDTLGANQTYIPGSITVNRIQNGNVVGQITPTVTTNGNVLTINLGNVNDYLDIYYNTATTASANSYRNDVSVVVNGETHTAGDSVEFGGGGTGSGYNGAVLLQKIAADTNVPLAGAHYQVVAEDGTVIYPDLITNSQGQIDITGLKAGSYAFIETQAAPGYLLNPTPLPFILIEGVNVPVVVTAVDQPLPKTEILVKKLWQNVPAGVQTPAITVALYRDGTKTDQTLVLNAANHYQATFTNLVATDSLGTPINYTVAEEGSNTGYTNLTPGQQTPDNGLVTLIDRYDTPKPTTPTKPIKPTTPTKPTAPVNQPTTTPKPTTTPSMTTTPTTTTKPVTTTNKTNTTPSRTTNNLPQTGEKDPNGVWTAVGLLVLFGLAGLVIKHRSAK